MEKSDLPKLWSDGSMKCGYVHYDGLAGSNFEYKKGTYKQQIKNNPDVMLEGGPNAMLHVFGADAVPLSPDFDYRKLDLDLIYFWIQGGINESGLEGLKKLDRECECVKVLFFDDIYWLDRVTQALYVEGWKRVTNFMDVLTNGYTDDGERLRDRLHLETPWKYLPYPHDNEYYKKFFKKEKPEPHSIFSMIHGRATKFDRTLFLMKELHKLFPKLKYVMHPYRFYTQEQVLKRIEERFSNDFNFLEFAPVVDNWFDLLSNQFIQIDEYPAISQSQVVNQAACLGVPTISHKNTASCRICFPKLCFPLDDLFLWYKAAKKLIKNPQFYEEVQQYAYEAVEDYSFQNFRERMTKIFKEFKR